MTKNPGGGHHGQALDDWLMDEGEIIAEEFP